MSTRPAIRATWAVIGLVAAATGGVLATPQPASALTATETVPISIDRSVPNVALSIDRDIFSEPVTFDQFDPGLGTLTSATLSWNLSATATGTGTGDYNLVARLGYAGRSASATLDTGGGPNPVPISFDDTATVTSGHVGTGTFSPADLVGRALDHSGTFTWGARMVVTGSITLTYEYTPGDTIAPTVTAPGDITTEATGPSGAVVNYPPASFSDNGVLASSGCAPGSGATFALGVNTVTCTATDTWGNTGSDSFTITVRDTTDPTVTAPGDITREATGPGGATVTYPATFSDTVALAGSGCAPPSGSVFPLGLNTVTCTATDTSGNTATDTFTITVQDTTDPVASIVVTSPVEATSAAGASVAYTVDVIDADATPTIVCVPPSGSTFGFGLTTISCTVTDDSGNSSGASAPVVVQDTTGPVVGVPADVTIEATDATGAVVGYPPATFSDNVGVVTSGCEPASGSLFAIGPHTVTCSAADARGNSDTATFTITVEDTTSPSASIVVDAHVEATSPSGAPVAYVVDADDAVGVTEVDCAPASGSTFAFGTTTIDCTVHDEAGNMTPVSTDVLVEDTIAPTATIVVGSRVEATSPAGATIAYDVDAHDAGSGLDDTVCTPAPGTTFAPGTTTIECTVSDLSGNVRTLTADVEVSDTTPPSGAITVAAPVEATGPQGAPVAYTVDVSDAVGVADVSCTPMSGATLAIGVTTIACAATDPAGNVATFTAAATVQDHTPPTADPVDDLSAEATGPDGAVVRYDVTARDTVGVVRIECDHPSGSTFALGRTPVACAAVDAAGNRALTTFVVSVTDTTPPDAGSVAAIQPADLPAGITVGRVDYPLPAVTDTAGPVTVTCTPPPGSRFAAGDHALTCTATDQSGNVTDFTTTLRVSSPASPALPATGSSPQATLLPATVASAAGLALLAATRRRGRRIRAS